MNAMCHAVPRGQMAYQGRARGKYRGHTIALNRLCLGVAHTTSAHTSLARTPITGTDVTARVLGHVDHPCAQEEENMIGMSP